MKILLSCFYGDCGPGYVVEVDNDEGKRLIAVGAGKRATSDDQSETADDKPRKKKAAGDDQSEPAA